MSLRDDGWLRKGTVTYKAAVAAAAVLAADTQEYPQPTTLSNAVGLITKNTVPVESIDAGAHSALTGGGDIRFTSDAAGNTLLPCQVVTFVPDAVAGNRLCQIHVRLGTVSLSTDTVFYMWYKKAGATQPAASDPAGSQAVWAGVYEEVYHFEEDPSGSAPQILDSTSNARHGTSAGSMTSGDLVAAALDNGIDLDGTDDLVQFGTAAARFTETFTASMFVTPAAPTTQSEILTRSKSGTLGWGLWIDGSPKKYTFYPSISAGAFGSSLPSFSTVAASRTHVAVIGEAVPANRLALAATNHTHGAAAVGGDYIYCIGGHSGSPGVPNALNQRYDTVNDTWTVLTSMPTARWGCTGARVGNEIYVFGGAVNATPTGSNKTECYDIVGDTWSTKTNCPAGISQQGVKCVAVGTDIYLLFDATFYKYDTLLDTFTAMTSRTSSGSWAPLVYDGSTYIYAVGGSNEPNRIGRYDVAGNSWSQSWNTSMPYTCWAPVAEYYSGYLYFGFGRKSSGQKQRRLWYRCDVGSGAWTQLASDSCSGNALYWGTVGDKLYILGDRASPQTEKYASGYNSKWDFTNQVWLTNKNNMSMMVNGVREEYIAFGVTMNNPASVNLQLSSQDSLTTLDYAGKMDELRLANTAIPYHNIAAWYANFADDANFLVASAGGSSLSVPGAPTIGTATAGDASASVTFSAPADNGGAAITLYTATSSPGGFTGTSATSPITVSGLTNGVAYTFTVKATNSEGQGSASAASNSVTPVNSIVAASSTWAFVSTLRRKLAQLQ